MLKKLTKITRFAFLILLPLSTQAQTGSSSLNGKVVDGSGKGLGNSVIRMILLSNDSTRHNFSADSTGKFAINHLVSGIYHISVGCIGFQQKELDSVKVKGSTDLGAITLSEVVSQLQGISIVGKKPLVVSAAGKVAINTQSKLYKTASNALELISRLPSVSVIGDEIRINGNVEPVVLEEGRKVPLTIQELKNIPADQVKSAVIVTNPGAEYEGDYKAVINIKLRNKSPENTLGLSTYVDYTRNKYNGIAGGLNLVYQHDKSYAMASYDYSNYQGYLQFNNHRIVNDTAHTSDYAERSFTRQDPKYHSLQLQYEYQVSPKASVGVNFRGGIGNGVDNEISNSFLQNDLRVPSVINYLSNNEVDSRRHSGVGTIDYKQKLAGNDELDIEGNYGNIDLRQHQYFTVNNSDNTSGVTLNDARSQIILKSINADLKKSITKSTSISAGGKWSESNTDNSIVYDTLATNQYQIDYTRTNVFTYREKILAGYAELTQSAGAMNVTAGMRIEHTNAHSISKTLNSVFSRSYINWLPYLQVSRKFSDAFNADISYSKRISRPSFNDLNPFTIISSSFTNFQGNPYLIPATINSVQGNLNYNNFSFSIAYNQKINSIHQMPFYDFTTKVLTLRMVNIGARHSLSYTASYSKDVTKWYTVQATGILLYDTYNPYFNGNLYHLSGYNFTLNNTNAFTITPTLSSTLTVFYTSPSVYDIYHFSPQSSVNIGLRKLLMNKRLAISAEYRDAFRDMKDKLYQRTPGFYNAIDQYRNSRAFDVRITFNLQSLTQSNSNINFRQSDEEQRIKDKL